MLHIVVARAKNNSNMLHIVVGARQTIMIMEDNVREAGRSAK